MGLGRTIEGNARWSLCSGSGGAAKGFERVEMAEMPTVRDSKAMESFLRAVVHVGAFLGQLEQFGANRSHFRALWRQLGAFRANLERALAPLVSLGPR